MRKYLKWIPALVICGFLLWVGRQVYAQANPHGYTCTTTSVTSTSVPTAIMTPAQVTTWIFHNESGSAVAARVFPYMGNTVPTAVPSPAAYMELSVGSYFPDQTACSDPTCKEAMGEGWAAVLASGSTAINVDTCAR